MRLLKNSYEIIAQELAQDKFYAGVLTYIIFIGVFLFLFVSLISKEVIQLFSKEAYWSAYRVIPIILLTYLIWSTRPILDVGMALKRKTKVKAWYFFIGATTNVSLNVVLIPKYGMMGVAYATLISFIVMILVEYYYNRKLLKIDYEWRRILKMSSVAALIFMVGYTFVISHLYLSTVFKVLIILAYPLLLCTLWFYRKEEIRRTKQILGSTLVKLRIGQHIKGT